MKIGLNATCFTDRPSGARQRFVGVYTELFDQLENDEFVVYEPADCRVSAWFDNPDNVVFRRTPLISGSRLQKHFRGRYYWPKALGDEKFDIFEIFHQPAVFPQTGTKLLTIHDIRRIVQSESWSWRERYIYNKVLSKSFGSADRVITVSESARNEISLLDAGISTSVVYNGVDIKQFESISRSEMLVFKKKYGLPDEYLLAVGHFEERKNYIKLIDAIFNLSKRGLSMSLVIVGNDSGTMAAVEEKVHSLDLGRFVKIYGGLTDLEVRCLYKLCKLFVFPSSYEGFGIPILEAMAAGRPMVLSDIPVFREITQEKGIYFTHDDSDSMANSIDLVLSSESEQGRLIEYGNDRVKDFSFKKVAKELACLYRSML